MRDAVQMELGSVSSASERDEPTKQALQFKDRLKDGNGEHVRWVRAISIMTS